MKRQKQESRYLRVAQLAYKVTQAVLPLYRHANSPKVYTQPQLVASVLLKGYLNLSWRDLEDWLLTSDQIGVVLELEQIPDHTTLYRAFQHLPMAVLRSLNHTLLRWLGVSESVLLVDATGFSPTQASAHYRSVSGRTMSYWHKGFYVVGSESCLILTWFYTRGPGGLDAQYLDRLRQRASPYAPLIGRRREAVVIADKGFDGKQARPTDFIRPRRGQHPVRRADRRLRADLTDMAALDGFMGQRWKIETVFSVIKRLMGDTIAARSTVHQRREVALKGIVYNLHRHLLLFLTSLCNTATEVDLVSRQPDVSA